MKVISIIVKNRQEDKPNEDCLLIDEKNKLFLVVDGVSRDRNNGIYPNPSPSAIIAGLLIDFIKNNYNTKHSLKLLFEEANKFIGIVNSNFDDYFKPGIVALCVRLKDDVAEWISIGDCIGLLIRNGKIIKFNSKQTQKLRESLQKIDSKTIRTEICNNPNHILAYGVIDGNPNANLFFETGNFKISKGDNICLFSDGLEMLTENNLELKLIEKTVEEIILEAEKLEIEKNIRTDDKTFIRLTI